MVQDVMNWPHKIRSHVPSNMTEAMTNEMSGA